MQEEQITLEEMLSMSEGAPEYDSDYFYNDIAEHDNNESAIINDGEWYSNYVMDETGCYVEVNSKSKLTKSAFDNRFFSIMPKDDKGRTYRPSAVCMGLIPTVDRHEYSPDLGSVYSYQGMTVLNTYKHTYMNFNGDHSEAMSLIKGHLKFLFNDVETEGLILDWMAWNVQHTGKIKHFAPLIVGRFGDGKSTITVFLRRALGSGNVNEISNSAIGSAFTAWANSSAVGAIEELKLNGVTKYETYNKLKPYITNEEVEVIKKGKNGITVKNTTNYIAFTNYRDAIPIEEGDRRYWVINTQYLDSEIDINSDEYKAYFTNLYQKVRSDVGQIRSALMAHKISDKFMDMNTAPRSDAKDRMRAEAMSGGAHAILERLNYHGNSVIEDGWINVTHMRNLEHLHPNKFDYDKLPTGKALEMSMRELGYKTKTRQTHGARNTLYK